MCWVLWAALCLPGDQCQGRASPGSLSGSTFLLWEAGAGCVGPYHRPETLPSPLGSLCSPTQGDVPGVRPRQGPGRGEPREAGRRTSWGPGGDARVRFAASQAPGRFSRLWSCSLMTRLCVCPPSFPGWAVPGGLHTAVLGPGPHAHQRSGVRKRGGAQGPARNVAGRALDGAGDPRAGLSPGLSSLLTGFPGKLHLWPLPGQPCRDVKSVASDTALPAVGTSWARGLQAATTLAAASNRRAFPEPGRVPVSARELRGARHIGHAVLASGSVQAGLGTAASVCRPQAELEQEELVVSPVTWTPVLDSSPLCSVAVPHHVLCQPPLVVPENLGEPEQHSQLCPLGPHLLPCPLGSAVAEGRIREDDGCQVRGWHFAHGPQCSRNPAGGTGALAGSRCHTQGSACVQGSTGLSGRPDASPAAVQTTSQPGQTVVFPRPGTSPSGGRCAWHGEERAGRASWDPGLSVVGSRGPGFIPALGRFEGSVPGQRERRLCP